MERCEYNPVQHRASYEPDDLGACPNETEYVVGADGLWHLCGSCAALPEFRRFKKTRRGDRGPASD
jgi:hypothetical protein